MNRPDDSFSDFETGTFEQLQRSFTDFQLINQTHTHQLYRAKRFGWKEFISNNPGKVSKRKTATEE